MLEHTSFGLNIRIKKVRCIVIFIALDMLYLKQTLSTQTCLF